MKTRQALAHSVHSAYLRGDCDRYNAETDLLPPRRLCSLCLSHCPPARSAHGFCCLDHLCLWALPSQSLRLATCCLGLGCISLSDLDLDPLIPVPTVAPITAQGSLLSSSSTHSYSSSRAQARGLMTCMQTGSTLPPPPPPTPVNRCSYPPLPILLGVRVTLQSERVSNTSRRPLLVYLCTQADVLERMHVLKDRLASAALLRARSLSSPPSPLVLCLL